MRLVAVLAAATAGACLSTPGPAGGTDAGDAPIDTIEIDTPPACADDDGDGWPSGGPTCGRILDCDEATGRTPGAREDGTGAADLDCVAGPMLAAENTPDLAVVALGTGIRVTARHTILQFHPSASHQLSSLEFASGGLDELLFVDADNQERWSGAHVWEGFFSTQATGAPVLASGPAVVTWTVPFSTSGMTGTSVYTITVDGRVQRHDAFSVSAQPSMPALKSVTSYVALDGTLVQDVTWAGAAAPVAVDRFAPFRNYFDGAIGNQATWLCARTAAHDLVWANATGATRPGGPPAGPRVTSGYATGLHDTQVALQHDWIYAQGSVPMGDYAGDVLLVPTYRSTTLACGVGAATARAYTRPALVVPDAPATLTITDPGDVTPADGFVEAGAYYAIDAGGGPGLRFTIDTSAGREPPRVSTFLIGDLPVAPLPVVVRTPPAGGPEVLVHGRDYRMQADARGLWLVLMVDLPDGTAVELVQPYQP